jgi:trans-aconitate 2-methyltransferase
MTTTWNPDRYTQFSAERSAPFFDLLARVRTGSPRRVVDLGCGPGNLTLTLAERWPEAEVVGLDSSTDMLETARALPDLPSNLRFERADIAEWTPSPVDDVVVTNAALQWVPTHTALLPRWFAALPAGATFAMQVPGNFDSPAHTLLRDQALSEPWRAKLGDAALLRDDDTVLTSAGYLALALDAGLEATAWSTEYLHLLHGENAVLDWGRGTRLRPVLSLLGADDAAAFEAEYAAALIAAYPPGPHGTIYPFLRHFLAATVPLG